MSAENQILSGFCLRCAADDLRLPIWRDLAKEFGGQFATPEEFPTLRVDHEVIKQLGYRSLVAEIELMVFTTLFGAQTCVRGIQQVTPESRQRAVIQDIPIATTSQGAFDWLSDHGFRERLTHLPAADWRTLLSQLTESYPLDQTTIALETFSQRTQLQAGLEARGAQVVLLDLFPTSVPYPPRPNPSELADEMFVVQAIWVSDAEQLLRWHQWFLEQAWNLKVTVIFGCDPSAREIAKQLELSWIDCDLDSVDLNSSEQRSQLAQQIAGSLR